jgi:D-3-phosphoglycerate dehydrogenase / 2-oxoglutarate reductase
MVEKPNLLVTSSFVGGRFESLLAHANVYFLDELDDKELDALLPSIDCILVQTWWPDSLVPKRISRMSRLRFVQSGMAGVNHIPFSSLGPRVIVSSNAGGFSAGVAEYAFAMMLTGVKRVVKFDLALRGGQFDQSQWGEMVREILPLSGRTLGILGYGGIGRAVGSMGRAIGMNVMAFSRHAEAAARGREGEGVKVMQGREGMLRVLGMSDAMVIALPLSKLTIGLLRAPEFAAMKRDATLVNVARAEIVDEEALYDHLVKCPRFIYATDVWQIVRGKETYSSKFPLLKLPNFIGTPHVAGGSSALTGEPGRSAVENMLRFLKGEEPLNIVDPSEYI